MNEFGGDSVAVNSGPSPEVLAEIRAAYAASGALTAAGVDTYHLSTWTSRDFYGEANVEKVLLVLQIAISIPNFSNFSIENADRMDNCP